MDTHQLIRKAITNNLSEEELRDLRQLLAAQPELREELQIEQAMYDYRNVELKKELKYALAKKSSTAKKSKFIWVTVLFALALSLVAYYWSQTTHTEQSPSDYAAIQLAERSVSPVVVMDDEGVKVDDWSQAVSAYTAERYEEALQQINRIPDPNDEQQLYAGLCHIYAAKPDYASANAVMKSLQVSDDNVLYDQALWYGALTDIQLGRNDEAQAQLLTIVNKDLWKHNEAQELLRLLSVQ